jgi:hypothetical protein
MQWGTLSVAELQEFLEAFGLPTSGAKSELVSRLEASTVAGHVDRVAVLAVRTARAAGGGAIEGGSGDDVQVVKQVTFADREVEARRAAVKIEDEDEEGGHDEGTEAANWRDPAAEHRPARESVHVGERAIVAHDRNDHIVLCSTGSEAAACDGARILNHEQVTVLRFSADRVLAQVQADDGRAAGWLRACFLKAVLGTVARGSHKRSSGALPSPNLAAAQAQKKSRGAASASVVAPQIHAPMQRNFTLVCITGTLGAGKGAVVEYLKHKFGFEHMSVRRLLIQIIEQRQMPVNRDSMTYVANALRAKCGPAVIVEKMLAEAESEGKDCIIESIRTPAEVSVYLRLLVTPGSQVIS